MSLEGFYKSREERFRTLAANSLLQLENIDFTLVYDKLCDVDARTVIIGEAPGANEVAQKQPFVGAAGKNLAKLLQTANILREKIHITNAMPFRTLKRSQSGESNRTPTSSELKLGSKLLESELERIKPHTLILLGGSAKKAACFLDDELFVKAVKTTATHGFCDTTLFGEPVKLAVGFHPSPLVFNQPKKRILLEEFFTKLRNILD